MNEPCKDSAHTHEKQRVYEKLWAGREKVNTHTQAYTQTRTQCINISANCPLLAGQPPPYLGRPG